MRDCRGHDEVALYTFPSCLGVLPSHLLLPSSSTVQLSIGSGDGEGLVDALWPRS